MHFCKTDFEKCTIVVATWNIKETSFNENIKETSFNENIKETSFNENIKGKWQQNFLSSHLKETPKQYIRSVANV